MLADHDGFGGGGGLDGDAVVAPAGPGVGEPGAVGGWGRMEFKARAAREALGLDGELGGRAGADEGEGQSDQDADEDEAGRPAGAGARRRRGGIGRWDGGRGGRGGGTADASGAGGVTVRWTTQASSSWG